MKIRITMKDPDGVHDAVTDAVQSALPDDLEPDEIAELTENRRGKQLDKLKKWVEWDEYITIEFDTEHMTYEIIEP